LRKTEEELSSRAETEAKQHEKEAEKGFLQLEELKRKSRVLEEELRKIREEQDGGARELANMADERARLESDLLRSRQEGENMESQLREAESNSAKFESDSRELRDKNRDAEEKLKATNEEKVMLAVTIGDLEERVARVSSELEDSSGKEAVLKDQLMTARREIEQVMLDLELVRQERERGQEELQQCRISETKWSDELHRLREEKKELHKHMAILSGDSKAEVLLKQIKAEKDRVQHELGDQQRERQQVEDAGRILRREINGLRVELVEAEEKLKEVSNLQGKLLSTEERFRRAQTELTRSKEEQNALNAKLSSLETTVAVFEEGKKRLEDEVKAVRVEGEDALKEAVSMARKEAKSGREAAEEDLRDALERQKEQVAQHAEAAAALKAELEAIKRTSKRPKNPPAPKMASGDEVVKLRPRGKVNLVKDPRIGKIYRKAPKEVDDLTKLQGVGEVICRRLHDTGIYTYRQVAEWRAAQIRAISEDLNLKERIRRDGWQKQARALHKKKYGQAP
jgi:predicted flap endonuclease-1-like 5' DNA nuclease